MDEPTSHSRGGARALGIAAAVTAALATATIVSMPASGQGGTPLDGQRAQVRALEASLIQVDAEAQAAGDSYRQADRRVTQLREDIRRNTSDQKVAKARFVRAQKRLGERLRDLYTQGEPSTIELLVSSGSLTDAVDNITLLRRVERLDQAVLREAITQREKLASLRTKLVADQAEAAATRRELAVRVQNLQSLASQRARLLASARTTLMSMEREEADRRARAAAAAQAAALAQQQQQADAVANGSAPATDVAPSAPDQASPASAPSAPSTPAPSGTNSHLQRIAQCESGGNPSAISPGGQYRGKYQFDPATWRSVGGSGDPAAAPEAEQDRRAQILYDRTGPSSWPVCGAG